MSFDKYQTNKNYKLINQAYLEAIKSECKFKHGAIITKGSKIICKAYNNSRTAHKYLNNITCSTHAELEVLRIFINTHFKGKRNWRVKNKNRYNLNGYILWVVRVSNESVKSCKLLDSCPCIKCKKILQDYGFKKIGYSTNDGKINIVNINKIETTHQSEAQILYDIS